MTGDCMVNEGGHQCACGEPVVSAPASRFASLLADRSMWSGYANGVEQSQHLAVSHGAANLVPILAGEHASAVAKLADVDALIEAEIQALGDRWDRLPAGAA